ncbi:MAG: hypothetical protein WCG25_02355 [bacterium]
MISYNNDKPLDFNQVLKQEKEIYKKQLINRNEEALLIDLDIIKKRKIKTFSDRVYNRLQNLFILKNEKYPDII